MSERIRTILKKFYVTELQNEVVFFICFFPLQIDFYFLLLYTLMY